MKVGYLVLGWTHSVTVLMHFVRVLYVSKLTLQLL